MMKAYEVVQRLKENYDKEAANHSALNDLVGVPQDPTWHPEGDVYNHTKEVFYAMVGICDRDEIVGEARLMHEMGALGHDMGKPECTKEKTFADGNTRWVSPMHDVRVYRLKDFMKTMEIETDVFNAVVAMTKFHMRHISFKHAGVRKKPVAKFMRQLSAANITIYDMDRMVEADISGRSPLPARKSPIMQEIIRFVEADKHITRMVKNDAITVTGRFLIETMKVQPSKAIGVIVSEFKGKTFETEGEMEQIVFEWMEEEGIGSGF